MSLHRRRLLNRSLTSTFSLFWVSFHSHSSVQIIPCFGVYMNPLELRLKCKSQSAIIGWSQRVYISSKLIGPWTILCVGRNYMTWIYRPSQLRQLADQVVLRAFPKIQAQYIFFYLWIQHHPISYLSLCLRSLVTVYLTMI